MRVSYVVCLDRPRRRFRCCLCSVGLGFVLLIPSLNAQETADTLPALEDLVGKWSHLRIAIADEQRVMAEQEKQWRAEIALLRQENAALEREIESARRMEQSVEVARAEDLRDQERLNRMFEEMPPLLTQAELALQAWPARLPPPLRESLDAAFQRLPTDDERRRARSDGARLQAIVALYSEIEKLQQGVHMVKEILALPDGSCKEMDVFYLGLARAFAVSLDNGYAAVGRPTSAGWVWEAHPEIADQVRRAVAMSRREYRAEMVNLPFQVLEVAD